MNIENTFEIRPLTQKWFDEATPTNYKTGITATIGSGATGTIIITDGTATALSIEVVLPVTASQSLDAAYNSSKITVSLATTSGSEPDDTANTAALIADAINAITDNTWTATASGTGATALTAAEAEKDFVSYVASYGTPCPDVNIGLYDGSTYYYVCAEANNTAYNDGWYKFSLTTI